MMKIISQKDWIWNRPLEISSQLPDLIFITFGTEVLKTFYQYLRVSEVNKGKIIHHGNAQSLKKVKTFKNLTKGSLRVNW